MDTKKNTSAPAGSATPLSPLIDAMDFLGEARQFNEAAYMACEGLSFDTKSALQRVLGASADAMKFALDKLEDVQAQLGQGGAS